MRVALVNFSSATGHHGPYVRVIANTLQQNGHDAIVMGPPEWCEVLSNCADRAIIEWTPVGDKGYFTRNREYRRFIQLVFDSCCKKNIDIVHFVYIDGLVDALRRVDLPSELRLLATLHWYPFLSMSLKSPKSWLKAYLTLNWCLDINRQGGSFVLHSRHAGEILKRKTGSTPFVLDYPNFDQNAVYSLRNRHALRSELGLKPDDHLFLCFGGTRYDKGVDFAVRALAATPTRCHLLIAGTAQYFDASSLERLALNCGVRNRVHFKLRYIQDQEIGGLFSGADIILLPYRKIFTGQSGPLITAAAVGRQVIAADVPVLEETVRRFNLGICFESENLRSLAKAMSQPPLATAYVPKYDVSELMAPANFAKNMINVYNSVFKR